MRVEGDEEVVAGLAQLLDGDGGRTADDAGLVVLEDGAEHVRGDAVGHLVLAPLVRVRELESRAEHAAEHRVGSGREQQRIDDEPRVVHDEGDAVGERLHRVSRGVVRVYGGRRLGGGGGGAGQGHHEGRRQGSATGRRRTGPAGRTLGPGTGATHPGDAGGRRFEGARTRLGGGCSTNTATDTAETGPPEWWCGRLQTVSTSLKRRRLPGLDSDEAAAAAEHGGRQRKKACLRASVWDRRQGRASQEVKIEELLTLCATIELHNALLN